MPRNFFQQFEIQAPKIILTEVRNHNETSGVVKKQRQNDSNSKAAIITELQQVLKLLADVSQTTEHQKKGSQFRDPIIQQLQDLQRRALHQDYKQIQKLCMLAIGKRILNIQLKKKRQEFQKKQKKKSEIEEFFRENRIKKFDYDSLVEQKLLQNTLIVRPYSSGKGFVESGNDYSNMGDILIDCDYISVVREVNKLFFEIFSGKKKDHKTRVYDILFKILWIPMVVFLTLIVSLPFYTFENEEIVLTILMGIIIVLLSVVIVSTYLNVPNSNNQMEQSIADTKQYFLQLNQKNASLGKQYEWNCPDNFMFLEVRFDYNVLDKYQVVS